MSRSPRQESTLGIYHVVTRGNNRNWIFKNDHYKKVFMKLLINEEKSKRIELYAWCIMSNHYHLLIKSTKDQMAEAMWRINYRFAKFYNKKSHAVGHVFESRYLSEPINDEAYLLKVIRYIHNNPVKAKMVLSPSEYPFSSYQYYSQNKMKEKTVDILTAYFNKSLNEFRTFHGIEDTTEVLDTQEDLMIVRKEKAINIFNSYVVAYEIKNHNKINNFMFFKQMVGEMLYESKLSDVEISKIVRVSRSTIQRIKREIKR